MQHRAEKIIAAIDLYSVGSMSSKIKDSKKMASVCDAWNAELDKISENQFDRLMKTLPRKVKGQMSLSDVLDLVEADYI